MLSPGKVKLALVTRTLMPDPAVRNNTVLCLCEVRGVPPPLQLLSLLIEQYATPDLYKRLNEDNDDETTD